MLNITQKYSKRTDRICISFPQNWKTSDFGPLCSTWLLFNFLNKKVVRYYWLQSTARDLQNLCERPDGKHFRFRVHTLLISASQLYFYAAKFSTDDILTSRHSSVSLKLHLQAQACYIWITSRSSPTSHCMLVSL